MTHPASRRWEDYLSEMGREGTWAGHMELQAASQLSVINITVHQAGQASWTISNFPKADLYPLHRHPLIVPVQAFESLKRG